MSEFKPKEYLIVYCLQICDIINVDILLFETLQKYVIEDQLWVFTSLRDSSISYLR